MARSEQISSDAAEALPEEFERRTACRFRTIYRVAKVSTGCDLGLWRVRNISDRGMMLTTSIRVVPGEQLSIELSDQCTIEGQVVWCEKGQVGVEFTAPIDCAETLQLLAEECRSPDHRAPRLYVDAPALAYDETGIHSIRICDLSQQGVKFAHRGGFHPGMKVKLLMENGLERRGVVRWSDEAHAGLHLVEPIACAELESVRRLSRGAGTDPA
jgi:hypothetical protein